jgi:anti-sigma B factor antagonist
MAVFRIERSGDQARIKPSNKLTAVEIPDFQEALRQELDAGVRSIIFDLSDTTILDSSGIGLLIAAKNSLARVDGAFSVIHASPPVLKLLQRMRLINRLQVTGSNQ